MSYIKLYKSELPSDIYEQYATMPNAIVEKDCIVFYTCGQHEIIRDDRLAAEIKQDLEYDFDIDPDVAADIAATKGPSVVDAMWDAYYSELEYIAPKYLTERSH
jgi:hypothetical protein